MESVNLNDAEFAPSQAIDQLGEFGVVRTNYWSLVLLNEETSA